MSDEMRVGLIGAGRIGRVHAQTLTRSLPGVTLLGVADVREPAAKSLAEELGVPWWGADYRRLLDDPRIGAVLICSSTDTHAGLIVEAAEAGKHIFCEKPIALDLAQTDRAIAAAGAAGVKLQIGFNRRFDAGFRRVHELVFAGAVGAVHLLHIISRDPEPPPLEYVRVSGGIFLDMTIHDFDMARFLVGSEIEEVMAVGAVLVNPGIGEANDVDTALVTLRFANGALGVIDNSRRAVYGYDQRVEVFGSRGSAQADNSTATSAALLDAGGRHTDKPLHFFLERYAAAYTAELQAFCQALKNDCEPLVAGCDGRAALLAGLAATRSLKEGRPVRLAEVDGEWRRSHSGTGNGARA